MLEKYDFRKVSTSKNQKSKTSKKAIKKSSRRRVTQTKKINKITFKDASKLEAPDQNSAHQTSSSRQDLFHTGLILIFLKMVPFINIKNIDVLFN